MSEDKSQSKGMNALEQSLNDHMEICRLKRKAKRLKAENARLKAEVERLRKAGDAMAFNYEQMHDFDGVYDSDLMKLVDRWNAAKEGKEQP